MKQSIDDSDIDEQMILDSLTDTQRSVVKAWKNDFNATLKELADEVDCTPATVSDSIKKFGWLINESEWSSKNYKKDHDKIKSEVIESKMGMSIESVETDDSTTDSECKSTTSNSVDGGRQHSWAVGPPLSEIDGIETLQRRLKDAQSASDYSSILVDYLNWGNNTMVDSSVGIFSLSSAHECVNRFTGNCQVGGDECYAVVAEKTYDYVIDYTQRQEYFWDCIDADTFAEAFIQAVNRRSNMTRALKFNQHGDFRHQGDVYKVNRIANLLEDHGIEVYTYSASNYLDWSQATSDNLTVNQSNDIEDYGDRRFMTVDEPSDIPDDTVWCPYNRQQYEGVPAEERTKCGECTLCMNKACGDLAVVKE